MNTSALKSEPRAEHVHCTEDELVVVLTDGRTLSVPLAWFPRLANASARQRSKYELLGNGSGIHWPMLDEDISISGLLVGNPSIELHQRPTKRSTRRARTHAERLGSAEFVGTPACYDGGFNLEEKNWNGRRALEAVEHVRQALQARFGQDLVLYADRRCQNAL